MVTQNKIDRERTAPTEEVASEGGGPGDVEIGEVQLPSTGSEATETGRPVTVRTVVRRDETGPGRKSP